MIINKDISIQRETERFIKWPSVLCIVHITVVCNVIDAQQAWPDGKSIVGFETIRNPAHYIGFSLKLICRPVILCPWFRRIIAWQEFILIDRPEWLLVGKGCSEVFTVIINCQYKIGCTKACLIRHRQMNSIPDNIRIVERKL